MPWTEEEKQILIDSYPTLSNKELCDLLHKTEGQLRGMKERLCLNTKFNPFTDDEKQLIKKYYETHLDAIDLDYLSGILNRQKTSISRYANKEGLTNVHRCATESTIQHIKEGVKKYIDSDNYTNEKKKKQKDLLSYYARNKHPMGMKDKHHSEETKEQMSKSHYKLAAGMTFEQKHEIAMKGLETKRKNKTLNTTTSNAYSRTNGGYRKDLGCYFRSAWEANIARILDYENIEWKYESKRFYFDNPENNVYSYQPDFYLPQFHKWIEVKGWMDEKSKIRLKLFKQEYKNENNNLILIDEKFYGCLQDFFQPIINDFWECKGNYKNTN